VSERSPRSRKPCVPGSTTARCAPPGVSFWSLPPPEQATSSQDQAAPSRGSSHRRRAPADARQASMPQADFVMILTGRAQTVRYNKTILVGNGHTSAPLRRDGSPDWPGDSCCEHPGRRPVMRIEDVALAHAYAQADMVIRCRQSSRRCPAMCLIRSEGQMADRLNRLDLAVSGDACFGPGLSESGLVRPGLLQWASGG
jgi:hypothetical protein